MNCSISSFSDLQSPANTPVPQDSDEEEGDKDSRAVKKEEPIAKDKKAVEPAAAAPPAQIEAKEIVYEQPFKEQPTSTPVEEAPAACGTYCTSVAGAAPPRGDEPPAPVVRFECSKALPAFPITCPQP